MSACFCSCNKGDNKSENEDEQTAMAVEPEENIEAPKTLPKTKAFYAGLLEEFFEQHYGDCFKGSQYIENSISVIKLEFADEDGDEAAADSAAAEGSAEKNSTADGKNEVEVVGTHTYIGTGGYEVTGQKFKAVISIANEGFNIDVSRESTQILTSKSFWERGAGNMVFVQ